jgi:hypothetical protein
VHGPRIPGRPGTRAGEVRVQRDRPCLPDGAHLGETVAEALANAREVIELEIEDRRERGEELPPSDVDTLLVETVTVSLPAA